MTGTEDRAGERPDAARRASVPGCGDPADPGTRRRHCSPVTPPVALRTAGLTRAFGKQIAVDAVDLDVPRGAVYGFLGPNGSGKTTTIRMLLGLLSADAGRSSCSDARCRGGVAYVLPRVGALIEGPAFHPYLTGAQNLRRLDVSDATADPRDESDPHRRRAGAGRAHRGGRQEVPQLLTRHEAAARPRGRVAPTARPAHPRRADERPRPARHARGPSTRARARHSTARPCWSPAICSARSSRSPPTSG